MKTGICIPIIGPTLQKGRMQLKRAHVLGDLVEIRVDGMAEGVAEVLARESTLPVLLKGPEKGGVSVDLLDGHRTVRAYHNFEEVPFDLDVLCSGAELCKVACFCPSGVEALRLAHYGSSRTLAVGMGEAGLLTRVLAPLQGSPWTYAALDEEHATAPGQPTVERLREVYGWERLGPDTQLLGVVGSRVSHSPGIRFHNHCFRRDGVDAVYLSIQVPAGRLEELFQQAAHFPFVGLSVTMPHKEVVLPFMDAVDSAARAIGAVNTVVWRNGKILGFNTDGWGALRALGTMQGKRMVVLGAGGAARAIVWAAVQQGAEVAVMNRTASRAEALAKAMGCRALPLGPHEADILVQATSVGMAPDADNTPLPEEWIPKGSTVLETITAPQRTRFVEAAKRRGCRVILGMEMFLHQALAQQAVWFPERYAELVG